MTPTKELVEFQKQKVRFLEVLTRYKQMALSPIVEDELDIAALLALCFSKIEHNIPLHAMWLLEKYVKAYPAQLQQVYPFLLARLGEINVDGSQRIVGNIIILLLARKTAIVLSVADEELLIEVVFNWMIASGKAVAVIANCFEILYLLSERHIWIREELTAQIDYFCKSGPLSIQARGKKVQSLLQKKT